MTVWDEFLQELMHKSTTANNTVSGFWLRTGAVAHVVECLLSNHKSLSSNPNPTKRKKKV
jgi:hypothetical protein